MKIILKRHDLEEFENLLSEVGIEVDNNDGKDNSRFSPLEIFNLVRVPSKYDEDGGLTVDSFHILNVDIEKLLKLYDNSDKKAITLETTPSTYGILVSLLAELFGQLKEFGDDEGDNCDKEEYKLGWHNINDIAKDGDSVFRFDDDDIEPTLGLNLFWPMDRKIKKLDN